MDGWTDGRNFSPFYRTSSPIGAAALLPIHVNYQIPKQGKGTADHMMPLGDWFGFTAIILCVSLVSLVNLVESSIKSVKKSQT